MKFNKQPRQNKAWHGSLLWIDVAQALIIIFILAILYAGLWAQVFSGNWQAIDLLDDGVYVVYITAIGTLFYLARRLPAGKARKFLLIGSGMILFQVIVGLPNFKYTLTHPPSTWTALGNSVYPVLTTAAWTYVIMSLKLLIRQPTAKEERHHD